MAIKKGMSLVLSASLALTLFTSGGASILAEGSGAASSSPSNLDYSQMEMMKFPDEIVIKFKQGTDVEGWVSQFNAAKDTYSSIGEIPLLSLSPLFQNIKPSGSTWTLNTESVFDRYYTFPVSVGSDINGMIELLKQDSSIEEAYLKPQPVEPPSVALAPNSTPVQEADDPFFTEQGYAMTAPQGINAPYAWQFEGGDGKGVNWVDIEYGWALSHEDLVAHNIQMMPGTRNNAHFYHGTGVLGEISAVDNNIGNLGIANKAQPYVSGQIRENGSYNTAEAIIVAANGLTSGDVMLLEAQASYPTQKGYVPIEVHPAEFDAIQYAVSRGIVVVEAAANGSVDLDKFVTTDGKYIFNRNHPDFKDSGAIMVGAGSSVAPHKRLSFSNHGNRIDVYGWGENVSTLNAAAIDSTTGYTKGFNGTSSASPIVTGAAIVIQGIAKETFGSAYAPEELRNLLKYQSYNTASSNQFTDKIGFLPDLKQIIDNLPVPGSVPYDNVAPTAPLGVTASNVMFDSVTLSWNQSTDEHSVIGYDVYMNGELLPKAQTTGTQATFSALTPNTTYSFTVKARDTANNLSQASELVQVTTPAEPTCTVEAWSASTAYSTGQQVSYRGIVYKAKWWTQNQQPDLNSGPSGPWEVVGNCQ